MKLIGITMGCPVGIGPEIIVRFFDNPQRANDFVPVVLGDIGRMNCAVSLLGSSCSPVSWLPGDPVAKNTIPVLNLSSLAQDELQWGTPTSATGKAMILYIEKAVRLIQEGILQAMVTCPITKSALKLAGSSYPGHTEMLAALSGSANYRMMMAGQRLKVVLVTIHEPLSQVPVLLSQERIISCIETTVASLQNDFGILEPKIAVCGLNPHAGEEGMFGNEELDCIQPAIALCSTSSQVSGPWPPDTVFHRAAAGEFDAVVAMYHDQGLIPFKLLHFSDGVNVTLGLSIVRTSVDHGTAYDIAGLGKAHATSLTAAWELAGTIVKNRNK